jgi:hypothetical protein
MDELSVQGRMTMRYINDRPTEVVIERVVRADDGAGGTKVSAPTFLGAQTFRIVDRTTPREFRTADGTVLVAEATVICMPDADILRGDRFTHEGIDREVVWVTDLGYEKLAEVSQR